MTRSRQGWTRRSAVASGLVGLAMPLVARASSFPERPIRFVVPLSAGGAIDVLGRLIGRGLEPILKQQVIIENKVGANGQIATEFAASQPPDGHTLLLTTNSVTTLPITNRSFRQDILKIFEPITTIEERPLVVIGSGKAAFKTFAEMIAYAKANPGKLNCAVVGAVNEVSAAWINSALGIQTTLVRYRGSAPAFTGLLTGEVDYTQSFTETVDQYVGTGEMRIVATLGKARTAQYPEAPTVSEFAPEVHWNAWSGLLAPAGTPRATIDILTSALAKALAQPDIKATFDRQGSSPALVSPEEFAKRLAFERGNFSAIAEKASLQFQ